MPLIKSCLARRQYTPFNGSLHICDTHTVFSVYVVIIQKTPVLPFDTFSKKWDKFIPFGLGQSLFHSKEEMAALRFTPQQHTEGTHSKNKCTWGGSSYTQEWIRFLVFFSPHIYTFFPCSFQVCSIPLIYPRGNIEDSIWIIKQFPFLLSFFYYKTK